MNSASIIRLVLLAAIWGGSFLFMKIAAPVLGAPIVAELRVFFAAAFLLVMAVFLRKPIQLIEHWRHYLIIGFLNSALPFLLFSYAALNLTASMLSILNATAPIWGAVCVALWDRKLFSVKTLIGLLLGVIGVSVLLGFDPILLEEKNYPYILAAVGAAICYGVASTYAKHAKTVNAFNNAHGSMWGAALVLLPIIPFFPVHEIPELDVITAILVLGVVCSGIAYLLYFRLIKDVGATSALTVTFLIPLFGVLWGTLFLNESVGWHTMVGTMIIICGTALVMGFSFKRFIMSKVAYAAK